MPESKPTPAQKTDGAERRRWARANADLSIHVALARETLEARVRDLSRAGVCFFLERPIPLMTVLQVAFELERGAGVNGQGVVVRCERIAKAVEHYEVAVFLHEMNDADRARIERYVNARAASAT